MKENIKVGILDDDESKVNQMRIKILTGIKKGNQDKMRKYATVELIPIEISLEENASVEKIVDYIIENELNAILLDYKLSSFSSVNFSGVDVAESILNKSEEFPIFMVTSFEDDLFNKEIFDPYKVINYERYISEVDERIEVNFKIIELIHNKRKKIKKYEEELIELLKHKGESTIIDSQILELDSKIEKLTNKSSSIPIETKTELSSDNLSKLLETIDWIIENE